MCTFEKFATNEQNYIFRQKNIYTTRYIHIYACDDFILPKTRANKSKEWTHYSALNAESRQSFFTGNKCTGFYVNCATMSCNILISRNKTLTGGNWQKWKRVFLTCPCHNIYRDEAVGLKSCKNTWKITIFVKMWNLGQYRENLIFCQ